MGFCGTPWFLNGFPRILGRQLCPIVNCSIFTYLRFDVYPYRIEITQHLELLIKLLCPNTPVTHIKVLMITDHTLWNYLAMKYCNL